MSFLKKIYYDDYENFKGKTSRKEYWLFLLFVTVVATLSFVFCFYLYPISKVYAIVSSGVVFAFLLGSIMPFLAISVRRMHDVGKSGWYLLIPIYNLILTLLPSKK